MTVTSIHEYKTRDVVAALAELLNRAQQGRVQGLMFIAKTGPRRHIIGVTGEYWDDPEQALGAAARLVHRLNEVVDDWEASAADTTSERP